MKTVPVWITDDNTRLRLGLINKLLQDEHTRHAELRNKQARTVEENAEMREINLRANALERAWEYAMPVQPGLPDTKKKFSDRERQILEQQFSALVKNGELHTAKKSGTLQATGDAELKKAQETIARLDKEYGDLQRLL